MRNFLNSYLSFECVCVCFEIKINNKCNQKKLTVDAVYIKGDRQERFQNNSKIHKDEKLMYLCTSICSFICVCVQTSKRFSVKESRAARKLRCLRLRRFVCECVYVYVVVCACVCAGQDTKQSNNENFHAIEVGEDS